MPIDLIATAFDQILELAKEKGKRSEKILKALNAIGLKQDAPLDKGFDGVYAYTLVVYGIDKPKPILEFFRHEFIKNSFQKSFEQQDESILHKEAENFLEWNEIGKELIKLDYDPRQEFAEFQEKFIAVIKLTRTVQEVIVEQKLDEIPNKDYLDEKFEPIYKKLNEQASSEIKIQGSESSVEFSIPSTLFFVGQEEALESLAKGISSNNVIVIGGIAGIGKTYLIAHFADIQTDSNPVLWLDFSTSNNLETVLLNLSEFFKAKFEDSELWQLLRNPSTTDQNKLNIAANVIDKYGCFLVWDNFDSNISQPLLPLLGTLNKMLRRGKLFITTREFFEIKELFNPIFQYIVPAMSPKTGIEFMRAYQNKLGLPNETDELLTVAYKRVGGHPYFMSRLIILSVTLPFRELVNSLPHLSSEAHKYIQEQISNQLDQDTRKLLQYLSVIRQPFEIAAIDNLVEDVTSKFDQLTKKFLITKVNNFSSYYQIHDLVKEFELSYLTPDDYIAAHLNAATYYANLEIKTFSDGVELVNHLIKGKKYNVAEMVSNDLLSSALHEGLFDFAISFSHQLIVGNVFDKWGPIYFLRGRAFRLKGDTNNALESYTSASQKANDNFLKESAQIEMSSMLFYSDKSSDRLRATKILNKLVKSNNNQIKIQALTSLGYVAIREKRTRKKGLLKLQEALQLAEKENLHRNVMQICHSLGDSYLLDNQMEKALEYLERSRTMREEVSSEYGEIDLEADYHLFKSLEDVYRNLNRYSDAVNAATICTQIDRKYDFQERLALSLFNLGEDLCFSRNYFEAQSVLSESLDLIKNQKLGNDAEKLVRELIIVSTWYLDRYETSIELLLEYIMDYMKEKNFAGKHVILPENELSIQNKSEYPQVANMNGFMLYLLVLPNKFTFQDVKQWHENVLSRRPELAPAFNPIIFSKEADN